TPRCHGRQVRARRMECGQSIGMPKWNARRRSYRIASEKSKCRRVCIKYTRAVAKFTNDSMKCDCAKNPVIPSREDGEGSHRWNCRIQRKPAGLPTATPKPIPACEIL